MNKLNLNFVTELIGEEYKLWDDGDIITINSQTGTGKNHFVLNKLLPNLSEDESMLYVCNRSALRNETKLDLHRSQGIDIPLTEDGKIDWETIDKNARIGKVVVRTYQGIAEECNRVKYNTKDDVDFDRYRYCIFDEVHHVMSDSFTGKTDLVWERLLQSDNTAKIFVSATMDGLRNLIDNAKVNKRYNYTQSNDYSYVKPNVFTKLNDIATLIKNDKSDDKWIVFVYSKKDAPSITDIVGKKNCLVVDAKSKESLEAIVESNTFTQKVLITTCVLDNGVNFKDEKIKHIVITDCHKTKFIQMLGRIRLFSKGDGVYANDLNLYIPKLYKKNISGMLLRHKQTQDKINDLRSDENLFNQKYNREYKKLNKEIFYQDNGWKVNTMGERSLKYNIRLYEMMLNGLDEDVNFVVKMRLGWLGLTKYNEVDGVMDNEKVMSLEQYLDSLVGKRLYIEEQEELTAKVIENIAGVKIDKCTKKLQPTSLEKVLREDLFLDFAVSKKNREDKIVDGARVTRNYITITKIDTSSLSA